MFNIGGGEFVVIALIALIVLGPQRLPDAARQVGKAMGELRRLSSGFQSELKSAFDDTEQRTTAPPRDVLATGGAAPGAQDGSAGAPGRTTSGNGDDPTAAKGAAKATSRPRRKAPLRADPVPDDGPASSNGS